MSGQDNDDDRGHVMRWAWSVLGLLMVGVADAQDFSLCGEIDAGARDYRSMTRAERAHIEGAHFTQDVAKLRRGKSGSLGNDIDYTLRHMPNNPRALAAMMLLGKRLNLERVPGATLTVACYFERAVRFAPTDGVVRYTFGMYLLSRNEAQAARTQFDAAAEHAGDNPNLHYNLGLVFADLGDWERALNHARRAYQSGQSPPGLAERLKKAGKWTE